MAEQKEAIDFWQRTLNKVFWLGIAGIAALGVNTAIIISQDKNKKNKRKPLIEEKESPIQCKSPRKDSFENLYNMPIINLEGGAENKISRKNSHFAADAFSHHMIHRIVFSGGPCGGNLF